MAIWLHLYQNDSVFCGFGSAKPWWKLNYICGLRAVRFCQMSLKTDFKQMVGMVIDLVPHWFTEEPLLYANQQQGDDS
jgi:hypothetical protein